MIRLTVLSIFVLFLWVYAFRDWTVSLCGLILLTALMQKGDTLAPMAGMLGLNLWNITLAVVTVAWLLRRQRDRRPWKLSRLSVGIVGGYIGIIILGYVQAILDMDAFPPDLQRDLWLLLTVDYLINPLKFLLVALLLADGCHSRRRLAMALGTVVGLGVLYAIMVVKIIPLEALGEGVGAMHYRSRIDKQIGLGANDMARVLTLTFWSILAIQPLWFGTWWSKVGVLAAYPVTFLGLAMSFSRAGYLTFVALGFVLGCVRWRKLLWLGPPALLLLLVLMPSVTERMSMGFDPDPEGNIDWNDVTAGRTGELWPPTIEEIWKAPFFGHGRWATAHTPAYRKIAPEGGIPVHPHNGYLEVLVDTGAIGLLIVLAAFMGVGILSYRLVRQGREPLLVALGGVGLVHVTGCLVNAMSGTTLFPNQGMLGTLCAFGIVLRVWSGRVNAAKPPARVRAKLYGEHA
jgi:O-antigen ligase